MTTSHIELIIKEFDMWKRYMELDRRGTKESSACANGIYEFAISIYNKRRNINER